MDVMAIHGETRDTRKKRLKKNRRSFLLLFPLSFFYVIVSCFPIHPDFFTSHPFLPLNDISLAWNAKTRATFRIKMIDFLKLDS
jgi:hypothetical protein